MVFYGVIGAAGLVGIVCVFVPLVVLPVSGMLFIVDKIFCYSQARRNLRMFLSFQAEKAQVRRNTCRKGFGQLATVELRISGALPIRGNLRLVGSLPDGFALSL